MNWDPSFFRKSPLFWPIARGAAALEHHAEWPEPEDLGAIFPACFAGDAPVRFVRAAPKPRRRREPARVPESERYDAQIVAGVVPTRARSWHDLLNALVWGAFPSAKRALHARQHRIIAAQVGADLRLPSSRTKEQDSVAMLDEGGVVLLRTRAAADAVARALIAEGPSLVESTRAIATLVAARAAAVLVFGHGIYESLVCAGPKEVRAAAHVVDVDRVDDARACIAAADEGLARLLSREAPIGRGELAQVLVGDAIAEACRVSAL